MLSISDSPIYEKSQIWIEGYSPEYDSPMGAAVDSKELFSPLIKLDYVEINNSNYSLTSVGKNFSNYLESLGYQLLHLNGKSLKRVTLLFLLKHIKKEKLIRLRLCSRNKTIFSFCQKLHFSSAGSKFEFWSSIFLEVHLSVDKYTYSFINFLEKM